MSNTKITFNQEKIHQPVDESTPLRFKIDLVRGNQPLPGESRETSSPTTLSLLSFPVCTAPGLAAVGQTCMYQAQNPEMRPNGKVLSRTVSNDDLNMDTSSDSQRKRQSADGEGFIHPPKSKTPKVVKTAIFKIPFRHPTYINFLPERRL